jgi:hypothetical protein
MSVEVETPVAPTGDDGVAEDVLAAPVEGGEGSTEAPASDPTTPEGPQPGVDRGDGRDVNGKFVPKGEPDPTSEPAAPEAVAPPSPATPVTPDAASPEPDEPFAIKFFGESYALEGAKVLKDGSTVIPATQRDTLERYMGLGMRWERDSHLLKQERLNLKFQLADAKAEADALAALRDELGRIAAIEDPDNFAVEWLRVGLDFQQRAPVLAERAELNRERQRLLIEKELRAPDPEQVREEIDTGIVATAKQHLELAKQDPRFTHLTPDDLARVEAAVQRNPARYGARAGQNLTPAEREAGIEPGSVYFRGDVLLEDLNTRAELRREVLAQLEEGKRAQATTAANRVRMAAPAAPPPPPANPVPSAAPAKAEPVEDYETKRDNYLRMVGMLR